MTFSLAVAIAIFFLISIRQWLPEKLRIWQIMLLGAVVLLVFGEISPKSALNAVDWNVIAYLFGVFAIAHALYDAGLPHKISDWIGSNNRSTSGILLLFMILIAVGSAVLTNDAAAVIGTPIALTIAATLRIRPALPLIALCAAVTIGSMMSPVGNPQNILIVADGHFYVAHVCMDGSILQGLFCSGFWSFAGMYPACLCASRVAGPDGIRRSAPKYLSAFSATT